MKNTTAQIATRFLFPGLNLSLSFLLILNSQLLSQGNPDPERFASAVKSIMEWDMRNSFPDSAILFIGSSSISNWSTRESFPNHPVINRGLSGALISDINYYIRALVLKYRPGVIVFYGGENDIAAGKGSGRVKTDFKGFAEYINKVLPKTKIIFISLKPTLTRLNFWPEMSELNADISELAEENQNLYYLDTASKLIDEEGQPQFEYFRGDGQHLNTKGYKLWSDEIMKLLQKLDSR